MRISAAVDLSQESLRALRWALDLRDRLRDRDQPVDLRVISIASPTWYSTDRSQKVTDDLSVRSRWTREIRDAIEDVGDVDDVPIDLDEGSPARLLARACPPSHTDWLVAGSSRHGFLSRLLQGSTAHRIARQAPCNVALVHPDHHRLLPGHSFAVGVDFYPGSEAAMMAAARLTDLTDGSLHLIHALTDEPTSSLSAGLINYLSPTDITHLSASARASLEALIHEVRRRYDLPIYTTAVHTGLPYEVLRDYCHAAHIDSMALGRVPRTKASEVILGSTTRALVRSMPTTLLLAAFHDH